MTMKFGKSILFICALAFATSSCSMFKPKYGCPSDGKNVGAEKLLDGSSKKAKKFRA